MVCLQKEQMSFPKVLSGKGGIREQMAITVNCVTDGVDQCHAGFIPCSYVERVWVYDGVLCQAIEVFDKNYPNCSMHKKMHRNRGFACIAVISKLINSS